MVSCPDLLPEGLGGGRVVLAACCCGGGGALDEVGPVVCLREGGMFWCVGPCHLGVCGCWVVFLALVGAWTCEVSGFVCSTGVSGWRGKEACCYLQVSGQDGGGCMTDSVHVAID